MQCLSFINFLTGAIPCVKTSCLSPCPLVSCTYVETARLLKMWMVTGGAKSSLFLELPSTKATMTKTNNNNNNNNYSDHTSSLVITAFMNPLSKSNAHRCVLKSLTRASIFIGVMRWVSVSLLADDGGCCCCCECNVWYARMYSLALRENFRTLLNVNTCSDMQCLTVLLKFSFSFYLLMAADERSSWHTPMSTRSLLWQVHSDI